MNKKKYTKKQIEEAISYWKKKLNEDGMEGHDELDFEDAGDRIAYGLHDSKAIAYLFYWLMVYALIRGNMTLQDLNRDINTVVEYVAGDLGAKNALRSLAARANVEAKKLKGLKEDSIC